MTSPADPVTTAATPPRIVQRVRVFIDFWNFQLSLNRREAAQLRVADTRFPIAWRDIGPWLAKKACATASVKDYSFEGVNIYTSYNPHNPEDRKFHGWVTSWLNRQPGVQVACRERKPKAAPRCPACYKSIDYCPNPSCGKKIVASGEKGVDTLIATDMIRLAWEDAYDIAVLATSDADLIPAVEFLNVRARRIIQAGFPPLGLDLATACWASFDVFPDRDEFRRPGG